MGRLLKYLKPFWILIVVSIGLLFIQANAELALPDYMSRIVNVGIQQYGVDSAVPEAIRASEMTRVLLFVSPEESDQILAAYTLVDQNSPDYETYLKQYPALEKEPVYVLTSTDKATIDSLTRVMGQALITVSRLEAALADPAKAAEMAASTGMDLSKLPPGMDLFAALKMMPAAQREKLTGAMDEMFAALSDSMVTQAAAQAVQAEYKALGMNTSRLQTNYILSVGAWMLLISLVSGICTIFVGLFSARAAAGLARNLRQAVFNKVVHFSNTEFDHFSTASLITRSTNDITQIQMVVMMMIRIVFYAPIIAIGGIMRAVNTDSSMWWIIALGVGVLVGMIVIVYMLAVPKFKIIQKLTDRLNLVTREHLSGMMVIRAFNQQDYETQRFDKANTDLTVTSLFIARIMVVMMPVMMFIMNGLSLLIIWVGSQQVAASQMQVGDMMAFMQYAMQIVFSFLMLSMILIILPRAQVSADRVADVLETDPTILDPEKPQALSAAFSGEVEFRNVSFRYPGAEEDVLHDLNFTARPGQTTAIIGTTGSGKSTVVNLIPRFYDVTGGAIYVDGIDIRAVTQHDLRAKIGYIPQKSTLFSGTIDSNLRYANDKADDALVQQALEVAQAKEFVAERPEGLAADISQGGANVSGGQKQRLSIARALVKQAPIYIFDDSFSALDFKTDAALRRALRKYAAASTLFIVTQRIATIKNAEQIIVLDEGRIIGKGRHHELMDTCEVYRDFALSQLSKEELS